MKTVILSLVVLVSAQVSARTAPALACGSVISDVNEMTRKMIVGGKLTTNNCPTAADIVELKAAAASCEEEEANEQAEAVRLINLTKTHCGL